MELGVWGGNSPLKIKMFEKILIVYNEKQTKVHLSTLEKVKEILTNDKKKFLSVRIDQLNEEYFVGVDLVITVGGDGTFARAANFIREQLILGINSEPDFSEGYIKSLLASEVNLVKEILNGKFKSIKRERAKVFRNGCLLKELVLEEVFAGAALQFKTSRYKIKFKGKEEEQRSSGVIICTGTGSTSWYSSAGGKAFSYDEKKLKFLVREPYTGKRVFKPTILHGEILPGEKIAVESTRDYGGIVALDGEPYDFNRGDEIVVQLSEHPLTVIIKEEK